jgi:hypothetical protein
VGSSSPVFGSLQPNQPGVSHVVVEVVVVVVSVVVIVVTSLVLDVDVLFVVVDSSKHPHQPGVLHVDVLVVVLVLVLVLVVDVMEVELVPLVWLLSKNSQLKQSTHSTKDLHSAASSYFSKTSWMTACMRCVPAPTLHPRSPTVS